MTHMETAMKAVRKGAAIVMDYFEEEKGIQKKSTVDLVTQADIEAEQAIVSTIQQDFPEHGFVVEEGDNIEGKEFTWIIDPIDGTTSFAHNYPFFCISIALFKDKKPYLGVVYAPYLQELFTAETGKGAFFNEKRIRVSQITSLRESLVATGFPYTRIDSEQDNLNYFSRVAKIAGGLRRSGSAALDVCYVACGRVDAYWELGLKIMDTAAAQLILTEAGGKVTDFSGEPIGDDFTRVVATNGHVHEELLNILEVA